MYFVFEKPFLVLFLLKGRIGYFMEDFGLLLWSFIFVLFFFFDNLESANKLVSENWEMNFSIEFPNNFKISKNSRNCHFVTNNFYYAIIHFPNIHKTVGQAVFSAKIAFQKSS